MKKEFVDLWAASNPPRAFCFYYCLFLLGYPALARASSCGGIIEEGEGEGEGDLYTGYSSLHDKNAFPGVRHM